MRKIFEWIGGFALIAFSFYFTDRVSLLVANKSELMEEIKLVSREYNIEPEDAVINIEENTIVPGKFGKKVNSEESYLNMHDFGSFNENYLIYDFVKPKKSLEENKDKYITGGNKQNRTISIILEPNDELSNYFESINIKYNEILSNISELSHQKSEIINGSSDKDKFKNLHSRIPDNKKICIKDYSNEEMCNKYEYYIIKPKLYLQNSNIAEIKNQIEPGSIILVSANCNLETIKLILNEIKYKDLNLVYISELIDEKGT